MSKATGAALVKASKAITKIATIEEILDNPFAGRGLTDREEEVAKLRARGFNPAKIGETLGTSKETVRVQLKNVAKKVGSPPSEFTDIVLRQIEAVLRNGHG